MHMADLHPSTEPKPRDNFSIVYHNIEDPYLDSGQMERIASRLAYYVGIARDYRQIADAEDFARFIGDSEVRSEVDWNNPALRKLIEETPTLENWVKLIPTAAALVPLEKPGLKVYPDGSPISDEARVFFANGIDARGVRYRNALTTGLYQDTASHILNRFGEQYEFSSASLGCGVGNSVLDALEMLRNPYSGYNIRGTFLDISKTALDMLQQGAEIRGVENLVNTRRHNVLNTEGVFAPRRGSINGNSVSGLAINGLTRNGDAQFDIVEAIGLAEYLKIEDSNYYRYGEEVSRRETAGLVTFVRNCYDLLKPGGSLFIGNMLYDKEDVSNISTAILTIGWPHIQPRSMEEMRGAFRRAIPDPNVGITAHLTQDCVYPLYQLQKPYDLP